MLDALGARVVYFGEIKKRYCDFCDILDFSFRGRAQNRDERRTNDTHNFLPRSNPKGLFANF
jgi:hypothetical protein